MGTVSETKRFTEIDIRALETIYADGRALAYVIEAQKKKIEELERTVSRQATELRTRNLKFKVLRIKPVASPAIDAVSRYLSLQSEGRSIYQIAEAIPLKYQSTNTALRKLIERGLVIRERIHPPGIRTKGVGSWVYKAVKK